MTSRLSAGVRGEGRFDLTSPLRGRLTQRGGGVDPYAVGGLSPSLVMDFLSGTFQEKGAAVALDDITDFSTTGNATMIGADGTVQWRPHNLLTYSEQFDHASWTKFRSAVTADAVISPDGTATADKLIPNASLTAGFIYSSVVGIVGQVSTAAVYVKAAELGFAFVALNNRASSTASGACINLSTGALTNQGANGTYSVTDAGNGWWKISCTATATTTNNYLEISPLAVAGSYGSYTGDGTSGIYLWGAHLYRSDLGGMVDNPDRGDSYVPTTSAARYLPRRGHHVYNGSEWVNEGLLVEPTAATNLVTTSTGLFAGFSSTVTATLSQANSLTGLSDASLWNDGAFTAYHRITEQATSVFGGTTYTISIFAKNVDRQYINLTAHAGAAIYAGGVFDISNGTVKETAAATWAVVGGNIEDFGGGWYRCSLSFTPSSSVTAYPAVYMSDGSAIGIYGTTIYAGGNKTLYAFGLQLEAGSTPSSYIPTSGATVTRAAETLTIPAAKLPYSATAMSIQMQGRATGDTYTTTRWYLDANNYITQEIGASDFTFEQAASGTVDAVTGGSFTSGVNTSFNIASRHGSTFINGAVDGTALTADTTPVALPELSAANLQLAFSGGPMILSKFRLWADDIGDAGIAEASA